MRDVHKTVLMHADVHEGAEGGHVGHHSLEHHAGLQVLHLLDAVGELRRAEFGTGITTGLQKFAKNVRHGRNAEVFVHEVAGMERTKHRRIADQRLDVQPRLLQDAKHNGIGLGMHGGGVKRIVAVGNAKEARRLLEGLGAQPGHGQKIATGAEGAVGAAEADNGVGACGRKAGNAAQKRGAGRIDVDADGVDAVLDDRVEAMRQLLLVNVVLILTHADRLGLDLDEFRERILQTARDGDGAAVAHVKIRELGRSELGSRIDGRSRLAHDHVREVKPRMKTLDLLDELDRLAACRAVAD